MNKTISIVIPTYNMEKYLDRCLSSLLIEREDDIEVLIVNDGSKDSSLTIAQKYASMYPSTFIIIDKPNGNYGSCINAALKVATGKYIKILDADDAFNSSNFNLMVGVLANIDVDMILTDFVRVYGVGKDEIESFNLQKDSVLNFTEITNNRDVAKIMMHSVTYKLENLLKIGYKQSEGIFYTDNEWIFLPISTVRKVYYIKKPIYLYTLNREGQSVNSEVEKLHSMDNIKVSCSLLIANSSLRNEKIPYEIKDYLNTKLYNRIRHNYKDFIVLNKCLDINQLQILDDGIHKYDSSLYKKLNKILLSAPLFSFHYIKIWRRKHNSRRLGFIISTYKKYKKYK
ncbi:glycosyltransferase family 2 protein [Xylanibacter oryzae]|uniref:glycosyltransferase family 2 protein n=1 Tax=Xylanibacter oryzae TaxID=185293 RepID=UPI0004B06E1F|nr:glycosyltransferase family 2 protein [Xylanibacter oryzae]